MIKKYTYRDNSRSTLEAGCWNGLIVFECVATSILEADALFEAASITFEVKRGNKITVVCSKNGVAPLFFIGCSFKEATAMEKECYTKLQHSKQN